MPRTERLDIPDLLQHVIVRGIEKRRIFLDDEDREFFIKRFSKLLVETGTDCLAWALMSNHLHLLLRPRRQKLGFLMRRLLTGYAIHFNLRHRRHGHLFQNRYKSIVCEEDPYLLELVRYIHLNPVRAGLVEDVGGLDHYPWSGHSVLLGKGEMKGQALGEVLGYFGRQVGAGRRNYRRFIVEGISQGRRPELVGGGLRRSQKLSASEELQAYDERVLGSGDFVEGLRGRKELAARLPARTSIGQLLGRVADAFGLKVEEIKRRGKNKVLADARAVLSYFAVRELGYNGSELGKMLRLSRSGVSVAAKRGAELMQSNPRYHNIFA
jgi:REP element-mobilizing transposase RayT